MPVGIVHQDVQAPIRGNRVLHHRLDVGRLQDVGPHERHPGTIRRLGGDRTCGRLSLLHLDVGHEDACTLLDKPLHDPLANPLCPAGHYRNLACETSRMGRCAHLMSPMRAISDGRSRPEG